MNDNPSPFGIHPDDQLEARLTAWVLGEASPFEIAELESLVAKSPELQLFLNRTRALHALLQEAETTANQPDEEWKLHPGKRFKIARAFGENPEIPRLLPLPEKESRIRRASFRAAWGIAAVFVITFFSLRLLPGDYEAEAVIEVRPRERVINPLGGEMSQAPAMTPQFFGTEFEKIKSRNSLLKVVDNLDLTARWNTDKETALKRLKDSVETKNIRGTDLISIRVRQPDEQDAKEITRAVTEGYRDYRSSLEEKAAERGLAELRKAVREQEDKVQERRKVLTTISRTKDIIHYGDRDMMRGGRNEGSEANYALNMHNELEGEKMQLESQIQSLLKYDGEALATYASGLDLPDNTVKALLPEKLELKREIEGLKASGLSDKHPTVVENTRILTQIDEQLNESVTNLRTRLQGQLDMSKERLAKLEVRKKETKKESLERSIDTTDYVDAKRDFETDLALLENMKLKLITEEIAGELPNESIVIHDEPTVARRTLPANPIAAIKKVFAADTMSSAPMASAELAAMEPSTDFGDGDNFGGGFGGSAAPAKETMEIAGNTRSKVRREVQPEPPAELEKSIVDAGNRSGDAAITRNSIDSILNNPERAAAAPAPRATPYSELSSLAQREIIRRQESVANADRNLLKGRDAYTEGDYSGAVDKYKEALKELPDSPTTTDRRRSYTEHLNDASIASAQQLRKVGKYDEARELLKQAETSAPDDSRIKQEITFLDDPLRTNPALTYEHTRNVDEVRRKLYIAQGNYDLGKYDDAKKAYEDTLRIDPYNKAARRGMEKIHAAKSDYYRAAYDQNPGGLLMEVDKAWELEIPAEGENNAAGYAWSSRGENQKADAGDKIYQMNTRAGSERSAADEPMKMDDLFSSSFGQAADIRWGGLKNDLSAYGDTDELDLYAGNADRTTFDAYQATQMNGRFDGFANYGTPIAGEPKQLYLTTKHVEINQANDKELGFDWLLPPFQGATPLVGDIPIVGRLFNDGLNAAPDEQADPFWDTSDAVAKAQEIEYEIHAGYNSEYIFRGRDLTEKQQPIDLADLSQEIPAAQEPFSTFSLNISDASFQLALAAVEKGERPDPASIKPEQFYNAVDYGDPAPSSLEPVAAAIDQTAHPVIPGRNLVRVAIRTASTGRSAAQPLRLTLLVDQSGSMARADRRAAMDTALAQLATLLTENDRITVIGFSRTPRLIADSLPGNEAAKISDLVNTTASEGGTNLEQAFNLSSELALRHKLDGAQNRIVLFTDGAANLGDADPDRLAGRVKELRQQGLAFDIAGIGTNDTNDRLLAELARHGNGRYYLVGENTGASLAAQLAGAFRPAAENVKVQVKLNPERVGSYKLIGFEKDRLKTEDFRDDSVDAAELAADEAGVAIYQVETLPEGSGEIGEVSVRFRDTASGEMVERAWTIPHDPSTPAFDKADPKTQLATLALMAAQKLQGGPLADAIRFPDHVETIARLKQAYANDAKAQRLLTLINALR